MTGHWSLSIHNRERARVRVSGAAEGAPPHLKLHGLFPPEAEDGGQRLSRDPVEGRRLVLGNNDVRINYVVTGTDASPIYRNAIGDECVYVQEGTGTVETVFGVLPY